MAELGKRRWALVFCDGTLVRRRARDFKEAMFSVCGGQGTLGVWWQLGGRRGSCRVVPEVLGSLGWRSRWEGRMQLGVRAW